MVVLAPHPDDETLGCGGTLAGHIGEGGKARVVYATDGSASVVSDDVTPERLAAIRKDEALAACETLGIAEPDCTFLEFPDSDLSSHVDTLTSRLREILSSEAPSHVFVCAEVDNSADHRALYAAAAAATAGSGARLIEYPVWFWEYRGWAPSGGPYPKERGSADRAQAAYLQRRHVYRRDIAATLDTKRKAMACHRSQMGTFPGGERWPTFPENFLTDTIRPHEFFFEKR